MVVYTLRDILTKDELLEWQFYFWGIGDTNPLIREEKKDSVIS